MLPSRLQLHKTTEDQLRRLKQQTKVAPNVASRIAFFRSVESGFRFTEDQRKLDGGMAMDKHTWLGEMELAVETVCHHIYPNLDSKMLGKAWAIHVEDGIAAIRNLKSMSEFINQLPK